MPMIFENCSAEISRHFFSTEHNTKYKDCVGIHTISSSATQCLKGTDLLVMTKCGAAHNKQTLRNTDPSQLPAYKEDLDCLLCTDETFDSMNTDEGTSHKSQQEASTQTDLSMTSGMHALNTCQCDFLLPAEEDERVDDLFKFAMIDDHRLLSSDTFEFLETPEDLLFLEELDHKMLERKNPGISFRPMHKGRTPMSLVSKLSFTVPGQSLPSDLPLRITADASLSHSKWIQSTADLNQHLAFYPRVERTPPKAVRASLHKLGSPDPMPPAKQTKRKYKRDDSNKANETEKLHAKRVLFAAF